MDKKFTTYYHHGEMVWVREDLKGTHREHCLCFSCNRFNIENKEDSCPIANHLYSFCVLTGLTAPVFECPKFFKKEE